MQKRIDTVKEDLGREPVLDPVDLCTLPPSGLAERLEWVEREIMPDAIGRRRLEDGVAIEFAASPGARARLEQWVALERKCCDGLGWDLSDAGEGVGAEATASGILRLEIRGVNPDGPRFRGLPLLDEDFDGALRPGAGLGRRRISRIFAAGGVGPSSASWFAACSPPGSCPCWARRWRVRRSRGSMTRDG